MKRYTALKTSDSWKHVPKPCLETSKCNIYLLWVKGLREKSCHNVGECSYYGLQGEIQSPAALHPGCFALLILNPLTVMPPCQQSQGPGALTVCMLFSPSCKHAEKLREPQPSMHSVSWCSGFGWWKHLPAGSVRTTLPHSLSTFPLSCWCAALLLF